MFSYIKLAIDGGEIVETLHFPISTAPHYQYQLQLNAVDVEL
jgi:hypothetical protein